MTQFLQLRSGPSGPAFVGENELDTVLWSAANKAWYVGPGGGGVESVFGRTGAVIAETGDYDSDQVDNVSTVDGASVSDALETLAGLAGPPLGGFLFCEENSIAFGDTSVFADPDSGSFQIATGTTSGFSLPDSSKPEILYAGPPRWFLFHADMAMSGAATEAETQCSVGIALNGDIVGLAVNSLQARAFGSMPIIVPTDAPSWLHSTRLLFVEDGAVVKVALATADAEPRTCTSMALQFWQLRVDT